MMVALASTLAAEFSNKRRRSLAVSTTIVGSAVGNFLVGLLASVVLHGHPWRWVFFTGAIAGAVLFSLALFGLPESPVYLMNRRSPRALLVLNKVLVRFGQAPVSALPVRERPRGARQLAFSRQTVWVTVRMAAVFMLSAMGAYYVLSWLPQLIAGAGFPASTASLVTAASTLVAIVSGLAAGALGSRVPPIILASVAMVCTGLAIAFIGVAPPTLSMLLLAACIFAFFQSAGVASFFATLTVSFPPLSRVSGMGLVMGIGRLTSGIGPYAAGALFAAGWTRMSVSMVFAAATMLAGLILATGIRRRTGATAADH
jgi:MFS family permease